MSKVLLRSAALGYLGLLLLAPVGMIAYRTFEHGIAPVWDALTTPAALHALYLSVAVTAIAVPMNLVFGIGAGILLARRRMPAGGLVNLLINLPFAMSPVVIGLALFVLYGRTGWIGGGGGGGGGPGLFFFPGVRPGAPLWVPPPLGSRGGPAVRGA